jgi:hypothetical protein
MNNPPEINNKPPIEPPIIKKPKKQPIKKNKPVVKSFNTPLCDKSMTFEECQLAILRNAIDINEKAQEELQKQEHVNGEELTAIFNILEEFISRKKLLLYGGFAINALLPHYDKFYDAKHDIPDYDVYSPNALEDTIELADLFYSKGYKDVESRAGVHYGTYKVYVNFNSIADITLLDKTVFYNVQKEAVILNKLYYCPVNFLKRNVYKELCQPLGEVTRWEKIFKRVSKLNSNYPLTNPYKCEDVDFQREMENTEQSDAIYDTLREAFIFIGAVFFGGYACSLYSQYMPPEDRKIIQKIPNFDVLMENSQSGAQMVKEKLISAGFYDVQLIRYEPIGEIIPLHYEIRVGRDTVAFIYEANECYSYNTVVINRQQIKVASIDTMLFFYFSFYYCNQPYYYRDRILCMIDILYKVEQENLLNQRGLLKRFQSTCIGVQNNLLTLRKRKSEKFKQLVNNRDTREYHSWFLKYSPDRHDRPEFMKQRQNRPLRQPRRHVSLKKKGKWENPEKEPERAKDRHYLPTVNYNQYVGKRNKITRRHKVQVNPDDNGIIDYQPKKERYLSKINGKQDKVSRRRKPRINLYNDANKEPENDRLSKNNNKQYQQKGKWNIIEW